MKEFYNLLKNVTSDSHYPEVLRRTQLLKDYFGVNHFWYYKITNKGHFSYFGTHQPWNEYCILNDYIKDSPNIRHPSTQPIGINFMNSSASLETENVLDIAWNKFQINFNLNLTKKISNGVESFGFATGYRDASVNQHMLNNLPLLENFIKVIKEDYSHYFKVVDENAVDVGQLLGSSFTNRPEIFKLGTNRAHFLKKLGHEEIQLLSPRETEVMNLLVYGYPAAYIGDQLNLSKKTVENYLASIKDKLCCDSKVELIQKAIKFKEIGLFG